MENSNELGQRICLLRLKKGKTLEEVSEAIGISHVSLGRYEKGQRKPKSDILKKLAENYKISIDSIYGDDRPKDEYSPPQTSEARLLAANIDKMPEHDRKRAVEMFNLMFELNSDKCKEGK